MRQNLLPTPTDDIEYLTGKYGHIEIPEDIRIIAWRHTLRPLTRRGLRWIHFLREQRVPSYDAAEFMHYVVLTSDRKDTALLFL